MRPNHPIPALLALLLLLAAPALGADGPTEVVLAQGETLASLAEKHLGSAAAAAELRALNGLAAGAEPSPGTRLRMPGPERTKLLARLAALEGAEAREQVQQARALMTEARYTEALAALPKPSSTSKFTVEVEPSGQTTVTVTQGPAIAVEASGGQQRLEKGHALQIRKGEPPAKPERLLERPLLAEPAADARIEAPATGELLGPVAFRWSAVEGAERYLLVITEDAEGRKVAARLESTTPGAKLTSGLKAGSYFWRVVANGGGREVTSLVHGFRLAPAPPLLEVQKPKWK